MRAGRRILDRVVQKVYQHLHHEPRVHISHQQLIVQPDADAVIFRLSVHMRRRLAEHVVQKLRLHISQPAPGLDTRYGQQVLHKADQPHGVVIYRAVQLSASVPVHVVFHQQGGGAGNAGERCSEVMGYRAQEICPQLLCAGFFLDPALCPQVVFVFEYEPALIEYRHHERLFKALEVFPALHGDAHDSKCGISAPYGHIKPVSIRPDVGEASGAAVMPEHPAGGLPLEGAEVIVKAPFAVKWKRHRRAQLAAARGVNEDIPLKQLHELGGGHGKNRLLALGLLQLLARFKKYVGSVYPLGRPARLTLYPHGKIRYKKRRGKHHNKGRDIVRARRQRVIRLREEKIEYQHRQHRGGKAVAPALGDHRDAQHTEDIQHYDIRGGQAEPRKQKARKGAQGKQSHGLQHVGGSEALIGHSAARGAHVGGGLVRNDVNIHIRRKLAQAVDEVLAREHTALDRAFSQHDLGRAADACILGYLGGRILAVEGRHLCAEPFCEADVFRKPLLGLFIALLKMRRLDKKRRNRAPECFCQLRSGTYDPRVRGRTGKAYKYLLLTLHCLATSLSPILYHIALLIKSKFFPGE